MFSSDVLQSSKITIDIPDVDFKIMLEMLRFMYTGLVEGLESIAEDLFSVAERYQIEGLKQLCEKSLGETINVDTVISTYVFAETKGLQDLKHVSKNFIRK